MNARATNTGAICNVKEINVNCHVYNLIYLIYCTQIQDSCIFTNLQKHIYNVSRGRSYRSDYIKLEYLPTAILAANPNIRTYVVYAALNQ